MGNKLAEKILKFIFKRIKRSQKDTFLKRVLYLAMSELYNNFPGVANVVSKDIFVISFNAKYNKVPMGIIETESTPYSKLDFFYKSANKGNADFLKDSFFRYLRREGDKEVTKLTHRLKKNQL